MDDIINIALLKLLLFPNINVVKDINTGTNIVNFRKPLLICIKIIINNIKLDKLYLYRNSFIIYDYTIQILYFTILTKWNHQNL